MLCLLSQFIWGKNLKKNSLGICTAEVSTDLTLVIRPECKRFSCDDTTVLNTDLETLGVGVKCKFFWCCDRQSF